MNLQTERSYQVLSIIDEKTLALEEEVQSFLNRNLNGIRLKIINNGNQKILKSCFQNSAGK